MKFNINDYVRVKLTAHGRAIHAADHVNFFAKLGLSVPYDPPKEDADGWSQWQLWELMQSFGSHVHNGCPVPFETEIEIIHASAAGDRKVHIDKPADQ